MSYNGWIISETDRAFLMEMFPPKYSHAKMSHITYQIDPDKEIPTDQTVKIVGYSDNGHIEALLVEIPEYNKEYGFFHITISHDETTASKDSNLLETFEMFSSIELKVKGFYNYGDAPYITTELSS